MPGHEPPRLAGALHSSHSTRIIPRPRASKALPPLVQGGDLRPIQKDGDEITGRLA